VLVVANSNSPVSLEAALAYMRARRLPPASLLRVALAENETVTIAGPAFLDKLAEPVAERCRALNEGMDYVVLMRDVPYRVEHRSTTAALAFGSLDSLRELHGYFGRQEPFDALVPYGGQRLRLTTVLSGYTLRDMLRLIERSQLRYAKLTAAGTFYLCEGAGPRGSRNPQIPAAMEELTALGARARVIPGPQLTAEHQDVIMQMTGSPRITIAGVGYRPGAVIDNMTSFGGYLLESPGQTAALAFIRNGACGAYGTVEEPTNAWARWANYGLAARYAAGANLAEAYFQSVQDMTLGAVVGDPLLAPFSWPCAVEVVAPPNPVASGSAATLDVVLKETAAGEGLSWLEVWLDDQHLVHRWSPTLPADASCQLLLKEGEGALFERSVKLEQDTDLGDVLGQLAGTGERFRIVRGGRHNLRLLVQVAPEIDGGQLRPLTGEVAVTVGNHTARRSFTPSPFPILARCAVLDFGNQQPLPGDRVSVTVAGQERSVSTLASDNMDKILERLVTFLEPLEPLSPRGGWKAEVRKAEGGQAGWKLWFVPKAAGDSRTFEIKARVSRMPGSAFATALDAQKSFWVTVPVGIVAEAAVTPFLPVPESRVSVRIAGGLLCPGLHTVTAVAATPRGVQAVAHGEVRVATTPATGDFVVKYSGEVFDPGEMLVVMMRADGPLAEAHPQLMLDGRAVCVWPPATPVGTFPLTMPLVCPGEHTLWVEWSPTPDLPSVTVARTPLARSDPTTIHVRRPLAYGLSWGPRQATVGANARLEFRGPYLHDDVRLMVGGEPAVLTAAADGAAWSADLSSLAARQYTLTLFGEARSEVAATLEEPLVIVPPAPPAAPESPATPGGTPAPK